MSEPDVSSLLTVAQAIAILDATPVSPRVVRVPLLQSQGLYLAEDLVADRDYPPFDKSLMDGYAVRLEDAARAPVELHLAAEIAAGASPAQALIAGKTQAIMTGAPIPPGAQGIVPIEDTQRNGDTIRILRADRPERYIARRGSDISAGSPVLARGTLMQSPQIAAAATIGASEILCCARPRVALLSTGDELIPVNQSPTGPQIRNANSPMLHALLEKLGCEVIDLGVVIDQPDLISAAIAAGLQHDALFVTGGMSMGTYDYVPRILIELGVELKITKLRIKPGKPFVFGVEGQKLEVGSEKREENESDVATKRRSDGGEESDVATKRRSDEAKSAIRNPQSAISSALSTQHSALSRPVFGLPGNPVSGFVCALRLASRLIQRMAGAPAPIERWLTATLAAPLAANGPREFYQPIRLDRSAHPPIAHPLNWKGSADVFTLAEADGFMARLENESPRPAGALIAVLEI